MKSNKLNKTSLIPGERKVFFYFQMCKLTNCQHHKDPQVGIDIVLNFGYIRHRHLFLISEKIFRTGICHSDIGRVPLLTSKSILISYTNFLSNKLDWNPHPLILEASTLLTAMVLNYKDVDTSLLYNVALCSLQSDIGGSDIRLSLISLITNIRLIAHLCQDQIQCDQESLKNGYAIGGERGDKVRDRDCRDYCCVGYLSPDF